MKNNMADSSYCVSFAMQQCITLQYKWITWRQRYGSPNTAQFHFHQSCASRSSHFHHVTKIFAWAVNRKEHTSVVPARLLRRHTRLLCRQTCSA